MSNHSLKSEYLEFMQRLINKEVDKDQWNKYVIAHYHDEVVENARRRCVELLLENDPSGDFENLNGDIILELKKLVDSLKE